MKKRLLALFLVLSALVWAAPALAAGETPVTILLRGFTLELERPAVEKNGATVVPVEEFLQIVGGEVQTDPADSTPIPGGVLYRWAEDGSGVLTVQLYDKSVTLTPGGGGAELRGGVLYAPLRPLAEGLGFTVTWDDGTVDLYYPREEVSAANLEEFYNAIAPDTKIVLAPGDYSFADLDVSKLNNPYVYVDYDVFDTDAGEWNTGSVYQIVIQNVRDLRIEASNVRLSTPWAYADVWNFQNCRRVVMEGGTAVHDVEPGYCMGNCVELTDCRDILLSGITMDGSGAYGLLATGSQNVGLSSCTIQNCTYGAVNLWDCRGVTLYTCRIRDNKGCFNLLGVSDSSNVRLWHCGVIEGNSAGALVSSYNSQPVVFDGCTFGANEFDIVTQSSGGAAFMDCEGLG